MNQQVEEQGYQIALRETSQQWPSLINDAGTNLSFNVEQEFAIEAMTKNPYLFQTAQNNPASLQASMKKVAMVGLSLNSASQYAYLVPRSRKIGNQYMGEVCLDISYKGLIKIATDTGSIKWAQAEIVREADSFNYKGPAEKPEHTCNPFQKDRGDIVGVYCIAKTSDNDYLVEIMTEQECMEIAGKSEAFKKGFGPWKEFGGEMRKKAVIKRASKTWPKTDKSERIQTAVEVLNEHEGIDFESRKNSIPDSEVLEQMDYAAGYLENGGEDAFMRIWLNFDEDEQMYFYSNKLSEIRPPEGMRGGKTHYKNVIREWINNYNQK